jgi:hypothetical protein
MLQHRRAYNETDAAPRHTSIFAAPFAAIYTKLEAPISGTSMNTANTMMAIAIRAAGPLLGRLQECTKVPHEI